MPRGVTLTSRRLRGVTDVQPGPDHDRHDGRYASLTTSPRGLAPLVRRWTSAPAPQPALPPLLRPTEQPPVPDAVVAAATVDPLVPAEQRMRSAADGPSRVLSVNAYRSTGWPATTDTVYVRSTIAERLHRVAARLPEGFGLGVFDGWRSLELQQALYDDAYATPGLPPGFVAVADPDPVAPPPHLTGATVDLTLTFERQPLALGTDFDDFTEAAHADHLESRAGIERDLRRMLYHAMRTEGFVVLDCEWWHFEHGTRYWAAVTGGTPTVGAAHL
jgi:D-alanyl-D-alanine dipeptidase